MPGRKRTQLSATCAGLDPSLEFPADVVAREVTLGERASHVRVGDPGGAGMTPAMRLVAT